MKINDWLIANIGLTFSESALVFGFVGSVVLNILQFFDRRAARTITLCNTIIKNLEIALDSARHDADCQKQYRDNIESEVAVKNEILSALRIENGGLQDKISELEKSIIKRPPLVARDQVVYAEAFPADPQHPVFYCAECWEQDRRLSVIELSDMGGYRFCKINLRHGRESVRFS